MSTPPTPTRLSPLPRKRGPRHQVPVPCWRHRDLTCGRVLLISVHLQLGALGRAHRDSQRPAHCLGGIISASPCPSVPAALHRAVGRHPFSLQLPSPRCFLPQNGVKTVPSLCEREVTCVLTDGSWPRGPGAGLAAQTDLHGPSLDVQEESCFSEEVRRDGSLCLTEEAGRRHRAPRCSWHPRRRSGRRRVGVFVAPLCSAAEGGVPVASELLAARPIATRPAGLPACPQARGRLERALTPCSLALASCAECHSVSKGGLGH